jgi:hypothetical protein
MRLQLVSEILELTSSGQYPISAFSKSGDKADQSISARPESPALNFRKLTLADPQKSSDLFLQQFTAELPDT